MPLEIVLSLAADQTVDQPQQRHIEAMHAPVKILAVVRVVRVDSWRAPPGETEPLPRPFRSLARAGLHGGTVEGGLETPTLQHGGETAVVGVLPGSRQTK